MDHQKALSRAAHLRDKAARETDPEKAAELEAEADALTDMAEIDEQLMDFRDDWDEDDELLDILAGEEDYYACEEMDRWDRAYFERHARDRDDDN